jgi:hypothetical protein
MSVLISTLIFTVLGLGGLLKMTLLFFPGLHDHLVIFSYYIKDRVYVPPMPRDSPHLRQRIVEAVAVIDREILQRM